MRGSASSSPDEYHGGPSSTCYITACVSAYLTLNLGLNFFNKWAFTPAPQGLGFSFPVFQSVADQVITLGFLSGLKACRPQMVPVSWRVFWTYKYQLTAVGLLSQGTVICNNGSLVLIGLSLNQMIKCLVPLVRFPLPRRTRPPSPFTHTDLALAQPTAFFAFLVEKKTPSAAVLATLLILVAGAVLAVPFDDPLFSMHGILLAFGAVVMASFRVTLSALLMRGGAADEITPIALVWYCAAVSVCVVPVVWLVTEERKAVIDFMRRSPAKGCAIAFPMSLTAAVYNILVFETTRITSSVSFTVLNCVKLVVLINVAAILLDGVNSIINWLGTALFYVGLFSYSYLKCRAVSSHAATQQAAGDEAVRRALGGERRPLKEGSSPVPPGGAPDLPPRRGFPWVSQRTV